MQEYVDEWADQGIIRLDAGGGRALRDVFPEIVEVLVAHDDPVFVGPSVGYPVTASGLQKHAVRQAQGPQ